MAETFDMDRYFLSVASKAAKSSTCAKKHLGCVLVTADHQHYIKGWNGPPAGFGACEKCRKTGDGITHGHECVAVHAERRVICRAARERVNIRGSTLYTYMGVPCKDCMLELWEAGVTRIVAIKDTLYDTLSKEVLDAWVARGGKLDIITTKDSKRKFHEDPNTIAGAGVQVH